MSDVFSPDKRSWVMRCVKGKNTSPELIVRRLVHRMGYRFRLHRKDLPGHPDLAFSSRKKTIFVHGCFWHGHTCPRGARIPKTNTEYWQRKIERNVKRDADHQERLKSMGWSTLIIWECEVRRSDRINFLIEGFMQA